MSQPNASASVAVHRLTRICRTRKTANLSISNPKSKVSTLAKSHIERNTLKSPNYKALTQNQRKTIFVQKHFAQADISTCSAQNVESKIYQSSDLLKIVSEEVDVIRDTLIFCRKLSQACGNNKSIMLVWHDLLSLSLSTNNELRIGSHPN
jgi:hypothetical protein